MSLTDEDVRAICDRLRQDKEFPAEYNDRNFTDISLAHLSMILAATAYAIGKDHEHYDELQRMSSVLMDGAAIKAARSEMLAKYDKLQRRSALIEEVATRALYECQSRSAR